MDHGRKTDAELLKAYCGASDPQAFEQLYRRYDKMVYGTCLRRLGSSQEAEDAVAATFMVLLKKAPELSRNRQSIAGWLQWCATNVAKKAAEMKLRSMDRERKAAEMREQQRKPQIDPNKWDSALPHLDTALATLPGSQRDVVVMHYMQGQTLASIAAETDTPEGTIAGRARLGLEKLRHLLTKHGPALSAVTLVGGLSESTSAIALPAGMAARISLIAGGGGAAATAGGQAGMISSAALKTMVWAKIKIATAVILASAAIVGGGLASIKALSRDSRPPARQVLLDMPDNTWMRLNPRKEARGRAFCGTAFGGGYLWYFGGGKHTYLANDVNLYDPRINEWIQATAPEQPELGSENWKSMTSSGGYTNCLSPSGNPYAEQNYQQVVWIPERERFFIVLKSSGTWEFDPHQRKWIHLVNRFENPQAEPRGSWAKNQVFYDPLLRAPLHAVGNGPEAHLRIFDYQTLSWKRLGKLPPEIRNRRWFSVWIPQWQRHLLMVADRQKMVFYKFQAGTGRISPLAAPTEIGLCDSLAYDSQNQIVLLAPIDKPGNLWKLDIASEKWQQLPGPTTAPNTGGLWGVLQYDPTHNVFLFLCFRGNDGKYVGGKSDIWAYRYKTASDRGNK
jgi:RNA polymerase sigma factor (sigma-70 family)